MAFWYGRINYEQRAPRPDDLKLEDMRALLNALGNPETQLRFIHVAGSKGKGSTSAMLAAIFRSAGYRVGLFTSPHLCRVEERIQIDGKPISQEELVVGLEEIRAVVEASQGCSTSLEPTFFEVATAAGLLHFLRRRVDLAILEVGLGGRLDSTNVIAPEVALITSISIDHTKQLGNTLTSIAREKAGILKPDRPAVSGVIEPASRFVIEQLAADLGAPLTQLERDFTYDFQPGLIRSPGAPWLEDRKPRFRFASSRRSWPAMDLALLGEHQAANAAVVLATIETMRQNGWHLSEENVARGLADVAWPARMEVLCRSPIVILDCAHNVASIEALVRTLGSSFHKTRRSAVFSCSNDKDVGGMLQRMAPQFDHFFLTRYGKNPRSVPVEELARLLHAVGHRSCTCVEDPLAAWNRARTAAAAHELICITGSVFLAGELRPILVDELHA